MRGSGLVSAELLDCNGRVTHRLTVLPDMTVRVELQNFTAIVNPWTSAVLPRGIRLAAGEYTHDKILEMAGTLARELCS
jgi:hypothetical protein